MKLQHHTFHNIFELWNAQSTGVGCTSEVLVPVAVVEIVEIPQYQDNGSLGTHIELSQIIEILPGLFVLFVLFVSFQLKILNLAYTSIDITHVAASIVKM